MPDVWKRSFHYGGDNRSPLAALMDPAIAASAGLANALSRPISPEGIRQRLDGVGSRRIRSSASLAGWIPNGSRWRERRMGRSRW